ncbi:hypothetical protein AB0J14_15670 [Micromonospora arborensis]|uniref:hypothetical protein n=1 Tax=Micromonospora arborensis TaxID=2116518 RepID=UPI0033D8D39F
MNDRQDKPDSSRANTLMWAVTLAAAAAGVPAAVQAGKPMSTTLLGVLLLLVLPGLILWRTLRGDLARRPRRLVSSLQAASVAVLLATATTLVVPAGRDFLLHSAFGWPDDDPSIGQATAVAPAVTSPASPSATSTDPAYRRARVVLENPSAQPRLVTHLEISSRRKVSASCHGRGEGSRYAYTITATDGVRLHQGGDQRFTGSAQEEVTAEQVTAEETAAAESARRQTAGSLQVEGRIRNPDRCTTGFASITVSFDVTVPLDPRAFTTIEVDFEPELLRASMLRELNPRDMSVVASVADSDEIRLRHCEEKYC